MLRGHVKIEWIHKDLWKWHILYKRWRDVMIQTSVCFKNGKWTLGLIQLIKSLCNIPWRYEWFIGGAWDGRGLKTLETPPAG